MIKESLYKTQIPGGGHWSLRMAKGTAMRLTDLEGTGNVGMLFYNPENLLERYNAPDTLKCQHTFKLTQGHCLYSDMGRIFCSVTEDTFGWHDTLCGNSTAVDIDKRWGKRDYQSHRNQWHQNGQDAFLVELAKYGLSQADMPANLNLFSKVITQEDGRLSWVTQPNALPAHVTLRFEMDSLVILHTCPHPLNNAETYPASPILIELGMAQAMQDDDLCLNACPENRRGFENNALYYLGR